jgi:hypothetical protein
VPDRSQYQLVLGDPKSPFGISQLDIVLPECFGIRLVQVAP